MATLKHIPAENIQFLKFPEEQEFEFQMDKYSVKFTRPEEIRMSYYIRDVKIFKNQRLFASGQTCDPEYLELTSMDNEHMFIPFENSYSIYDLHRDTDFTDSVYMLCGNHFDITSRYLLTVGFSEYKLTNLDNNKVVFHHKEEGLFISQAHFGYDNLIWTISRENGKQAIEKLDPLTLKKTSDNIPSPLAFFDIDKHKYQKLIDLNKHCLWISKGGGMLHSSLLDRWQFVKTVEKAIYKSVIPISDIRYSDGYKVDTCSIDYFYVSVEL